MRSTSNQFHPSRAKSFAIAGVFLLLLAVGIYMFENTPTPVYMGRTTTQITYQGRLLNVTAAPHEVVLFENGTRVTTTMTFYNVISTTSTSGGK